MVKGQGHQAVLLSAALTRKAAAAVSVGTYSAWESTAIRCVCSAAHDALGRPRGEERGGGVLCRHAHGLFYDVCNYVCRYVCVCVGGVSVCVCTPDRNDLKLGRSIVVRVMSQLTDFGFKRSKVMVRFRV